jgi:hypothetical protein
LGARVDVGEIVGAALDPTGVAFGDERSDGVMRERQRTDEIPAGEREDARLEGVVHREEQVDALDPLLLLVGPGPKVADSKGRGNDANGGAGDAVGGKA